MKRTLIFSSRKSRSASSRYWRNSFIRAETSSAGRFQFSVENAYTVRYSMPMDAQ